MKPQTNKQTNGPAYLYTQTNRNGNREKILLIIEHWGTVAALFVLPLLAALLIETLTK
jgi:hypothetical protein